MSENYRHIVTQTHTFPVSLNTAINRVMSKYYPICTFMYK